MPQTFMRRRSPFLTTGGFVPTSAQRRRGPGVAIDAGFVAEPQLDVFVLGKALSFSRVYSRNCS